jgi:hypothetical protein
MIHRSAGWQSFAGLRSGRITILKKRQIIYEWAIFIQALTALTIKTIWK